MKNLFVQLGAALIIALFATGAHAQNTPAPCDPRNIVNTYYQQSCWNSVDCSTGYQCLDLRVSNDVFYGTTCDVQYVAICSQPGFPNVAQKEKSHAKALLFAIYARARKRAS